MKFEWDEAKNRSNITKHGISFEQAQLIFYEPTVDVIDDRADYGETRIISLGLLDGIVVILVVHTDRNERIRLISARKASHKERTTYYAQIQRAPEH